MNTVIIIKPGTFSSNVYLVQSGDAFILIDTGIRSKRYIIEKKLEEYQCTSGKLKCILLTHGDFDHSGNALYFRKKFGVPVGIHKDDAVVLETGDMFINRIKGNKILSSLTRQFMGIEKFSPDFYLDDSHTPEQSGIDMKVVHTPGHSPGSSCIITSDGACFCGDLFENTRNPRINAIVDDPEKMKASVEKIMKYNFNTIYPGHGEPFFKKDLLT